MDILQKYSNQMGEVENRDDTYPGQYSASPYINCRNQYENDNENNDDGQESNDGSQKQQRHGIFDENFDLTEEDLEQIARCLLPLSPKGLKKNKAKQVSGRFEFKRINTGAVSVVKSHQKLDVMSPEDLPSPKEREGAAKHGKQKDFSPKKGKRGGLRRRFSFSSNRSKSGKDVDSGIHTDDALFHGYEEQEQKQKSPTKQGLDKKIKAGDLPPKPSPRSKPKRELSESVGAPSSRATASDVDHEEVISVESDMSDLSEMSIAEKAKERGPIVLTEAMLKTAVIPDTICLKKNVKLTKMEALRRKLSFSKGKI